jgi:uncharacterized protein DUF1876
MNEPSTVTTWSVDIQLGEHQGHSHAQVRLHTQAPTALTATGRADLSPRDPQDADPSRGTDRAGPGTWSVRARPCDPAPRPAPGRAWR